MELKSTNIDIYKSIFVAVTMFVSLSGFAAESRTGVFTLQDYFQEGLARIAVHLQNTGERGQALKAMIGAKQNSCVQIEISNRQGDSYMASMASATIVAKGVRLLSSGHNFIGMEKNTRVWVRGPNGEKKRARLLDMDYNPKNAVDWAILEVEEGGFHPQYALSLARSIKAQEKIFILGYPQSFALKNNGQVVHTRSFPNEALLPLVLLGSISHRSEGRKVLLNLEYGSIFLSGASGGPVLNMQGELMGIYTSFITEVGLGHLSYKMSMRPFPKALVKMLHP